MKKFYSLLMLLVAGAVVGPQMLADILKIDGISLAPNVSYSSIVVSGKTSGTISWDADNKILKFKNVVMNATTGSGVYFYGDKIAMKFEGKNVIKSSYSCFEINASNFCDICSSELYGPQAYVELEVGDNNNACVMMNGNGDLTVRHIYLKATAKTNYVIMGSGSNKIHFLAAWAQMKTQIVPAVCCFGSCEVGEGSFVEHGEYDTTRQTFVYDYSVMSEVKVLPELTVGGVIVNTEMGGEGGSLPVDPKGMTSGSISWDRSDKSLYFDKVVGTIGDSDLPYPYGTTLVHNSKLEGLLVQVKGANTINSPTVSDYNNKLGIYSNEKISIYGADKWGDIAANSLTLNGYDYALQGWKELSVGHLTLNAKGEAPIFSSGKLTFTYANVTATETTSQQTNNAIESWSTDGISLGSCDVVGGYPDGGKIYGKDGKVLHTVNIKAFRNNQIPYVVLGRALNEVNITDFAAKGWKSGNMSFNATSRRLTLKNVSIDASEVNPDVVGIDYTLATAASGDMLYFEGSNTIITGNKPALRVAKDELSVYTKDASGNSVAFGSAKNVGCYIENYDRLALQGTEITFGGYTGGVKGATNTRLILLKTSSGKGTYSFGSIDLANEEEPTPYPAFTVGTIIKEDGMGFDFNASLGMYDAAYWDADKKQPIKNGGDFARMVCIQSVTKKYGLFVAGIEVNDVNCYGMAGKAFTKEGSTQVTYNPSTGVLTLDNAYIDMKAAGIAANAIELNRYDYGEPSHSLSLRGESYIQTYNDYHGLYTLSDAVVSSATNDFKSSLEIHSSGGDGKAIYPENLTIKDRAYVKLTGLKGCGIGNTEFPNRANLTVDDATLDVEMYGIQKIKSLTLKGGSAITYPEGGRFDSEKQAVVDTDGKTAMSVQIRSANDNVTPYMNELAIDEVNFPDSKFRTFVADNFDSSKNGYLSKAEIEAIQMINISGTKFGVGSSSGLKGIEHFWNLKQLFCNSCMMEWPDLSKNTNLEHLEATYNYFYGNIDLSKNTKLDYLDVSNSYVTSLDLSANTALEELHCNGNRLTALDLTTNTKLKYLDIHQNKIGVDAMEALVNSLPTTQPSMLDNFIACQNEAEDGNQITKAQAAIAKGKNWNVYADKYFGEGVKGDVNGDGAVDVADIGAIIDVMAGSASGSLADKADVNGDKTVDVADIGAVIDIMAGKDDDQSGTDKAPKNAEAVDLGLPSGTKWANMNVGALYPWGYGLFFAWGETKGYTSVPEGTADDKGKYTMTDHSFDWASYKWCNGTKDSMTKYCTNSEYGTEDGMLNLLPEDDAAQANWGGQWVMPTYDEMKELVDNTTCTETTVNGVRGWEYTSDINGNSIFLPAAGYRDGDWLGYQSDYGAYWTATADATRSYTAKGLLKADILQMVAATIRNCGYSVRPVIRK